jgi:hypothetical protein
MSIKTEDRLHFYKWVSNISSDLVSYNIHLFELKSVQSYPKLISFSKKKLFKKTALLLKIGFQIVFFIEII